MTFAYSDSQNLRDAQIVHSAAQVIRRRGKGRIVARILARSLEKIADGIWRGVAS